MFQEIIDIKNVKHLINLKNVEYFAPDREGLYIRVKFPSYVLKISFAEWKRLKPFVTRL